MSEEQPTAAEENPDAVPCVRCRELKDIMELDRLLWCESCRRDARNTAGWWGWLLGLLFAGGIAGYIWLVIRPSNLIIGGWVATVVVALWLGSKLGREIVFGIMRYRNTPAGDVEPPSS